MTRSRIYLVLSLMGVGLMPACHVHPSSTDGPQRDQAMALEDRADGPATEVPLASFVKAQNQFGLKLYQSVAQDDHDGNILLSPLSIQTAFALLYPGTKAGEGSGAEMRGTFGFAGAPEDLGLHRMIRSYLQNVEGIFKHHYEDKRLEWALVNQVWVDQQFTLKEPYLKTIRDYYDAKVQVMDFRSSTEAAETSRRTINTFVSDHTKSLIKDLLPPGSVKPQTSVLLTNSVYVLADWQSPFAAANTREETFTTLAGQKTTVPMMNQTGPFAYAATDRYQVVSLPYVGGNLAMVLVLPRDPEEMFSLEREIDGSRLSTEILSPLRVQKVHIKLPKFTFTWGSHSLKKNLESLGLREVWEPGNQFPALGYLTAAPDQTQTWIDDVVHQAKIIVDEKGTEAAAATGVVIVSSTSVTQPPQEFFVDRPALFYMIETKHQTVLFAGRLADPSI